jgi:hypothetical protein
VELSRSSRFQVPGNVRILYHQGMFRGKQSCSGGNDAASQARRIPWLEADGGTEGHAKIVARAIVEVDLIANFEAKSNRTDKAFDTSARI